MKTIDEMIIEKIHEGVKLLKSPIEIIGAEHPRTDGFVCDYIPKTPEEYSALPGLGIETLAKYGCQLFSIMEDSKIGLWLYPGEWYNYIPAGTKIVSIFYKENIFKPGQTSNSTRFGALAFGFLK